MRKVISGLILAIVFGAALAIELPKEATLTMVDGSGSIVGVAEFKEGEFELELLEGFSGLVTVTSVDAEGNVLVFDASVGEDGSVTLIDTQTLEFVDLTEAVAAAGGSLEVSFDDEIETDDEADLDEEDEEEDFDDEEDDLDDEEDGDEEGDLDEESEDDTDGDEGDEQSAGGAATDDQDDGDDDSGSDDSNDDDSSDTSDDDEGDDDEEDGE